MTGNREKKYDKVMAKRMSVYDHMLYLQYGYDVISVVIYTDEDPMNMKNNISFSDNKYSFMLIDIREIDAELFLNSNNPKELIFSILAGHDATKREFVINELFAKLQRLTTSESELRIRLREIEVLSGLRGEGIQQLIKQKILNMPIVVDIRNTPFFKEGVAVGEIRGEAKGEVLGEIKGIQKATLERNTAFVTYLLENTSKSTGEIAAAVNVSEDFVTAKKKSLQK